MVLNKEEWKMLCKLYKLLRMSFFLKLDKLCFRKEKKAYSKPGGEEKTTLIKESGKRRNNNDVLMLNFS